MERRIEVRFGDITQGIEWTCEACPEGMGSEYADGSMGDVLRAAEARGLELGREFRMLAHLPFGYVEFWQEPTPAPNEAWATQPVLEAAS